MRVRGWGSVRKVARGQVLLQVSLYLSLLSIAFPRLSLPPSLAPQADAESITFLGMLPMVAIAGYVLYRDRYDALRQPQRVSSPYMVCSTVYLLQAVMSLVAASRIVPLRC